MTASLVASHIGLRVMGLAFGLISAGHQVGGATGAYLGDYVFDLYAQYAWVWWSSFWLAVLAGILVSRYSRLDAGAGRIGCIRKLRSGRRPLKVGFRL